MFVYVCFCIGMLGDWSGNNEKNINLGSMYVSNMLTRKVSTVEIEDKAYDHTIIRKGIDYYKNK